MITGCWCGPDERRLLQDLMENYQKFERPVEDESQPVKLQFGLTLQQIMDLVDYHKFDEKVIKSKFGSNIGSSKTDGEKLENSCQWE